MQELHPDYGCMKYRDLEPGDAIEDHREVDAARSYIRYRKSRGLPHLNLLTKGRRVEHLRKEGAK